MEQFDNLLLTSIKVAAAPTIPRLPRPPSSYPAPLNNNSQEPKKQGPTAHRARGGGGGGPAWASPQFVKGETIPRIFLFEATEGSLTARLSWGRPDAKVVSALKVGGRAHVWAAQTPRRTDGTFAGRKQACAVPQPLATRGTLAIAESAARTRANRIHLVDVVNRTQTTNEPSIVATWEEHDVRERLCAALARLRPTNGGAAGQSVRCARMVGRTSSRAWQLCRTRPTCCFHRLWTRPCAFGTFGVRRAQVRAGYSVADGRARA